ARADARAARRNRLGPGHRRAAGRRERREQPAPPRSLDRHGDALSAPARLHRARPRARALGRAHRQERRQVARARARKARLRLDQAGSRGSMSSVTAKQSDALARYRTLFEERFQGDPLLEQRRSALERFLSAGFPTQRDEAWKYTSLRRIESRAFRLGEQRPVAIATAPWIEGAGYRVVFLNGRWAPSLSAGTPLPPGATLVTLGEWLKHAPDEALAYASRA